MVTSSVVYDATGHVQKHVDANARETRLDFTVANQAALGYYPTAAALTPDLGWNQNYDGGAGHKNVDLGIQDANGNNNVVSYSGSPSPYLPSSVTNRNGEQDMVTNDNYGNVTDAWNVGRQIRSHMVFTDPGDLPMGQLTSSQTINDHFGDNLAATTFDYYGTTDGVYNGLLKSVTAPAPGASSHTATLLTMLSYTGSTASSLGNLNQVVTPGPNSTAGNSATYNTVTYGYGNFTVSSISYTKSETAGEPTSIAVSGPNPSGVTPTTRTETSYFEYDARGRRISVIDGIGNKTDFEYNAADQVVRVWSPGDVVGANHGAHTDYDYSYPGGPLSGVRLYPESDPTEANPAFRAVNYTYGHEGELAQVTGDVEPVGYSYDSAYRVTSMTYYQAGGGGFTTYYDYFPVGSLQDVRHPGYTSGTRDKVSYTYDADQNLATQIDGNNVTTTYAHDIGIDSRVNQISYSDPATSSVNLGYDHFNRVVSTSNGVAAKTFTLDDLSDLLTQTVSFTGGPQNQLLTYDYFPDGSRKTLTTPLVVGGQNTTQYQYYATGELSQTHFPWTNGVWQHKYGNNGWLSRTMGPLMGPNADLIDTFYNYTGRGLLRTMMNEGAEDDPLVSATSNMVSTFSGTTSGGSMVYDAAGNRQAMFANIPAVQYSTTSGSSITLSNDASHLTNYGYTSTFAKDTLTAEASAIGGSGSASYSNVYNHSFSYDQSSNLLSFQWLSNTFAPAYNGDNQYTSASSFTYDGNGNPTAYLSASANFAYDAEDRLTSVGSTLAATYGPDGLRATKTAGGTTLYYLYDGDKPLIEETWNGTTPTFTAYYGRVADGLRAMYKPTLGQFVAYLYDPQGNLISRHTIAAYNNHASVQDINFFEAYGSNRQRFQISGSVATDSVGFGGQWGNYTDNETGLVLMTHRYYDPGKGRFVTRDPIGYKGGVNLYGYAGGNPVNRIDPSGLDDKKAWWEELGEALGIYKHISHLNNQPSLGVKRDLALTPNELAYTGKIYQDPVGSSKQVNQGVMSSLTWALSMIPIPGGQTAEAAELAEQAAIREFSIIRYGDRARGFQKHHGVLDVWALANINKYLSKDAPAIVLNEAQHNATRSVFARWRYAKTGSINGAIDWASVGPREIQDLSEKMFDAAGIPQDVRREYYRRFTQYIYSLP